MAKKMKPKDVLSRIKAAGDDGVPANPARLARKWGVDVDPRYLGGLIAELCDSRSVERVSEDHGGHKVVRLIAC